MLNTSVSNNSKLKISAVSGTIIKSHKDSYMMGMHINSPAAREIFSKSSKQVVLQAMNTHDGYLLVELVDNEIWNKE